MAKDNKTEDFSIGDEQNELKDRVSAVSDLGARKKIGIVILILVCIIAVYYIFTKDKKEQDNQPQQKNEVSLSEKELNSANIKKMENIEEESKILLPPKLPELPRINELPAPPKPIEITQPIIPVVPQLPQSKKPSIIEPPKQSIVGVTKQNRQTPMLVVSGGGIGSNKDDGKAGITITDPTQLLDPSKLEDLRKALQNKQGPVTEDSELTRTINQQSATYVGDLDYIIGQGKMLDAILETAINTGLKGKIRALVSRDIFSDSGERILIPKGSRLIGEYDTNISLTQARVNIAWERIILPWGVDVNIDRFPGVDQLGRAGSGGFVDNKFANIFTTSLMLTSIKVASGVLVDKLMGNQEVTQNTGTRKKSPKADETTDEDGVKVKGSPGAIIAMNAIKEGSKQITDYVNRYANVTPIIKINQGTRLKVFVNKDIVFPRAAFDNYQILN